MANPIFSSLPTTIFEEMSGLAGALGAVNLGQGFPDDPGPEAIRAKAADAVLNGYNQYPRMAGIPELRDAVAAHYNRTQGLDLDASEITVTSGATEALACAFLGLIEPGDEVICFQPLYDAYLPLIRRAGGVPKLITLQPPHWRFDRAMLAAAFSARTARHRPLMGYPGMRERTVKIGSAGKMFGLTGWKVGFMCAAPALTHALAKTHQFLTFTTAPNLQTAVAWGLENSADWFQTMPRGLARSRDRLTEGLRREGFSVLSTDGTYFLCVDLPASGVRELDRDFALRAVKEAGVASVPVSALFEEDHVRTILRLCFSKRDETIDEGVRRLAKARDLSRAANPS
jgi:N-succinyldiaminopimelate aminotransferase